MPSLFLPFNVDNTLGVSLIGKLFSYTRVAFTESRCRDCLICIVITFTPLILFSVDSKRLPSLYGITNVQVYIYYSKNPHDSMILKVIVRIFLSYVNLLLRIRRSLYSGDYLQQL